MNIDESSAQSIEKIRLKKILGKSCLTNESSAETEILTFAVKKCQKLKLKIKNLKKNEKIIENEIEMMQKPLKKLKKFLRDLIIFCRERNIKLNVTDRLDYCDLLQPYHKIVCTYKRNKMLLKKLKKKLQYIKLFISLSK